jgi:hypothetical protein
MKHELPELYQAMVTLLRQDPLQLRNNFTGRAHFILKSQKQEEESLN